MMTYSAIKPAPDVIQAHVLSTSRTNFYLWMYLAQEGYYEDALEFVKSRQGDPTPFDGLFKIQCCQLLGEKDFPIDDDF